jgi:hypothetical protein
MLARSRPGAAPRLTAGQRDLILRALRELGGPEGVAAHKPDRSCATCDHEVGAYCRQWESEIPTPEAYEAGCERWRDDGVPF